MAENLNTKLCDALKDMRQNELEGVCDEIRKLLRDFISEYKEKHPTLVFNEPSWRIKDVNSFSEKIPRKNYIKSWDIKEETTPDECKQKIREDLDDLIGFRINCYFSKDENAIYESIISELESFNESIKIKEGKNGPEKQKNGLNIFKLKCKYTSTSSIQYLFELQIKCLIDNLWGEVDHEIAYKAKQYDYQLDLKSDLLLQVHQSLKASDAQLYGFYKSTYTEDDLINSLFFLYTQKEVNDKMGGKNCTLFYNKFFSIFGKKHDEIKEYVAIKLGGESVYSKKERHRIDDSNVDYFIKNIIEEKIGTVQTQIMVKEVQTIYDILFEFEESDFLYIMVSAILQKAKGFFPSIASAETEETDSEEPMLNEEQGAEEKEEEKENVCDVIDKEEKDELAKKCEFFDSTLQMIKESRRVHSTYDKKIIIKGFESFCKTFYSK